MELAILPVRGDAFHTPILITLTTLAVAEQQQQPAPNSFYTTDKTHAIEANLFFFLFKRTTKKLKKRRREMRALSRPSLDQIRWQDKPTQRNVAGPRVCLLENHRPK